MSSSTNYFFPWNRDGGHQVRQSGSCVGFISRNNRSYSRGNQGALAFLVYIPLQCRGLCWKLEDVFWNSILHDVHDLLYT